MCFSFLSGEENERDGWAQTNIQIVPPQCSESQAYMTNDYRGFSGNACWGFLHWTWFWTLVFTSLDLILLVLCFKNHTTPAPRLGGMNRQSRWPARALIRVAQFHQCTVLEPKSSLMEVSSTKPCILYFNPTNKESHLQSHPQRLSTQSLTSWDPPATSAVTIYRSVWCQYWP